MCGGATSDIARLGQPARASASMATAEQIWL
jgi:hypothetical protein